jgi:ADP-L-glycero-D-manno-heptose 6-epimerase
MPSSQRCLVTGGAGFIGSNLALTLETLGHDVTVVDDFSTGHRANLRAFAGTVIEADVAGPDDLDGPYDVIFHQAAISDPRLDDAAIWHSNIDGFRRIAEVARSWKARLIYASCASVYGDGPAPQHEDQPLAPMSACAQSKLLIERLAERAQRGQDIVGLRYFDVYGPREARKGGSASFVYRLARSIDLTGRVELFGSGEQRRDFVHVDDCVRANLRAIEAPSGIYNVGTGVSTSLADLARCLGEALDRPAVAAFLPWPRACAFQAHTQASTAQSRVELGFAAKLSLERGVAEYMKWLRRSGELDQDDDTEISVASPMIERISSLTLPGLT